MKKIRLLLCLILLTSSTCAVSAPTSLRKQINAANAEISSLKQALKTENESFKTKILGLEELVNTQSNELKALKKDLSENQDTVQNLANELKSLKQDLSENQNTAQNLANELKSLKKATSDSQNSMQNLVKDQAVAAQKEIRDLTKSFKSSISKKSRTVFWVLIVLASITAAIAFISGYLLYKRKEEIVFLKQKVDNLSNELEQSLLKQLNDFEEITKLLSEKPSSSGTSLEDEQKLITTLADRITFMEMTLYKMDRTVRGYKQLSKSIKQMKDNLQANGYELVDMLGKEYHAGMRVSANFIKDENLEKGKQVITSIIKPQINYKGKMIQSAQITVTQNI